jgi:mono/diheme cytochrome c family protein
VRNFILGIIITIVVLIVGALAFALLGFVPTSSDATPPAWETKIASSALDAAMERRAPRVNNPVPPTDANIIDGMKLYTMNCAVCHGGLDNKPSLLAHSEYPPPPQLILEPLDDPEWHIFYSIRTGVRYSGMPAWNKALGEQDIWKVTAFLSRLDKLSPAVQEYWKRSFGVGPPAEHAKGEHEHEHDKD